MSTKGLVKRSWKSALELSEQLMDDAQMLLYPGSIFDTKPLADSAIDYANDGDPVLAAALLLTIAERHDLNEDLNGK